MIEMLHKAVTVPYVRISLQLPRMPRSFERNFRRAAPKKALCRHALESQLWKSVTQAVSVTAIDISSTSLIDRPRERET